MGLEIQTHSFFIVTYMGCRFRPSVKMLYVRDKDRAKAC